MGDYLPPKKEHAARLLSQGFLQAEVARDKKINVTKQTMTAWMKDENFRKKIDEYKTDKVRHAEEVFARNVGEAAEVVVEIATSGAKDEDGKAVDSRIVASKLKAALFIIERTMGKKLGTEKTTTKKEEEIEEIAEDDIDDVLKFANA